MSKGQTFEPTYIVRDWTTVFGGALSWWRLLVFGIDA